MGLESIDTMSFGDALRCTASGADYSAASATIGTDERFQTAQFSMGFRFKIIAQGFTRSAIISTPRQALNVTGANGDFGITTTFDTTACDFGIQNEYEMAEDGDEHSVAWTYDGSGDSILYVDGTAVETVSAICDDFTGPVDEADVFRVQGTNVASTGFDVDDVWFTNQVLTAQNISDIHDNGIASFA